VASDGAEDVPEESTGILYRLVSLYLITYENDRWALFWMWNPK
jgi:hypothetical protein